MKGSDQDKAVVVLSGGNAPGAMEFVIWLTKAFGRHDIPVFGTRHGFKPIMEGAKDALVRLDAELLQSASPGSIPIISFGRMGPGRDPDACRMVVQSLLEQGVRYLVGFGGEGTSNTMLGLERAAQQIADAGGERLLVGMGPKSIDRDIALTSDTIGFQTKSELLGSMLRRIRYDAWMTDDRYFIVAVQGRTVGHLAYRAAVQSEASVWLIPEQFTEQVDFSFLVDIIVGTMLKGACVTNGKRHRRLHGHIVVSEGLPMYIRPETCPDMRRLRRDDRGRPKLADFPFHKILAGAVNAALAELRVPELIGERLAANGQQLGYTARGASPNGVDRELARELATALVHQLVREELSGIVPFVDGSTIAHVKLEELAGPDGSEISPFQVDTTADRYRTEWAATADLRLLPEDLEDREMLAQLVAATSLDEKAFLARFTRVAEWGKVNE